MPKKEPTRLCYPRVQMRLLPAFLALCSLLPALDWPRFRGPNGSGVAEAGALPAEFGPEKSVIWKTALPPGHSSPILSGDRIFITAFEGPKLLTIAMDRASGKILWRRECPRPRDESVDKRNSPASPSPASDGKNIYVFFPDFGLLSYDFAGNERWRVPLGPFNNVYGMGSSPIVAENKVILICDQGVGSSCGRLRQRRWQAPLENSAQRSLERSLHPGAVSAQARPGGNYRAGFVPSGRLL